MGFRIVKKSAGNREIISPDNSLQNIQSTLNIILKKDII